MAKKLKWEKQYAKGKVIFIKSEIPNMFFSIHKTTLPEKPYELRKNGSVIAFVKKKLTAKKIANLIAYE